MSRRKKTPAKPAPSPWYRVHTFARCGYGHDIAAGTMAYYNRTSKATFCGPCMKQHYDIDTPAAPPQWVFHGEAASDHRARQTGGD